MRLTLHFTLNELTRSATAKALGIDNSPNENELKALRQLARGLEEARAIIRRPIEITSGFRCDRLNRLVGGVPDSAHRLGWAADIRCARIESRELARHLARAVEEGRLAFLDQMILEADRGVVHLSFAPPHRRMVLEQLGGVRGRVVRLELERLTTV